MSSSKKQKGKSKRRDKPISWSKVLKQSQEMEKSENLRKLYRLFVEIKSLMEKMSPNLKNR